MEAQTKKPLYKRWWVIVLGVIVIFAVIGSVNDSQEQATQTVTQTTNKESGCLNVSNDTLSRIEMGLTTDDFSLRNAKAVQSNDFEKVYFVSANVQDGGIATFAMNNLDGPATVFAVDDQAKQITDWPHGDVSQANITLSDDGARESRDCL